MARRGLEALLVQKEKNRIYLSGFTGTAGSLLITTAAAYLLTDFRYVEQAAAQAPAFSVQRMGQGPRATTDLLARLLSEHRISQLGFEADTVSFDWYEELRDGLRGVRLVPASGAVEALRKVKEPTEIEAIRRAAALADQAFAHILEYIRPGVTERDVALELEFFMRRRGASGVAFDTIVASGRRSSLPHGVATDKVIAAGELVTLDFGCVVDRYCSDMTRTVVVGEPDAQQRQIYDVVLNAQQAGVAAARAGQTGKELDHVCRQIIADSGYGEYFGHGTGHAVGLDVHEDPRVSPTGQERLVPGHVVTIEPGIYLPGWGGVRIEDLVVITADGCDVLSRSPKELIILD